MILSYFWNIAAPGSRRGQYSGERRVPRPGTAEDGRGLGSRQGVVATTSHPLIPPTLLTHPPLHSLCLILPLDGMSSSSTRHSQEMNSEHLPRALYGHKIPLAVELDNQGTTTVVKRCEAKESQASVYSTPLLLSWTVPEAKELKPPHLTVPRQWPLGSRQES